jgi:hypothetical protein
MVRSSVATHRFLVVQVSGEFLSLPDYRFGLFDRIVTSVVRLVSDIARIGAKSRFGAMRRKPLRATANGWQRSRHPQ